MAPATFSWDQQDKNWTGIVSPCVFDNPVVKITVERYPRGGTFTLQEPAVSFAGGSR